MCFCFKWRSLLDICAFTIPWEGWDLACNWLWNVLAYGQFKFIVIQLYNYDSQEDSSIFLVHEGSNFALWHLFEFEESLYWFDPYVRTLKSPFIKDWNSTARNRYKRQRHLKAELKCQKILGLEISRLSATAAIYFS